MPWHHKIDVRTQLNLVGSSPLSAPLFAIASVIDPRRESIRRFAQNWTMKQLALERDQYVENNHMHNFIKLINYILKYDK